MFNRGFGLSLSDTSPLAPLDETCGYLNQPAAAAWYDLGRLSDGIVARAGAVKLPNLRGEGGGIVARGVDKDRQEDAREITFGPGASLTLEQTGGGSGGYRVLYNLPNPPAGKVTVRVGETVIDITRQLELSGGKGWREMVISDQCAAGLGDSFTLRSEAPLVMRVARIERQALPAGAECSF